MLKHCRTLLRAGQWNSTVTRNSSESTAELAYTLKESDIDATIKSVPTLSNISPDIWQTVHNLFLEYGFKTKNFIQIITEHPKLLTRPTAKINASLEFWRGFQFGENRVEHLIVRYPELLDVLSDRKIQVQINSLQSMVSTSKNVWMLLMNSPNLLNDSPASAVEKFDYLQNVMRLDVSEIVKSQVFSFSLDEIKTRHVFLERLGIFKPRNPKAPPGEISKNPRLHMIMEPDGSKFATKVALSTLAEFEAFKQLYKRELDRTSNRRDESDDDEFD